MQAGCKQPHCFTSNLYLIFITSERSRSGSISANRVLDTGRGEAFHKWWAKGVYPQREVSLAMKDIDASKGFFDLWEHLSFAIFAIFDPKRQLKLLGMACDQVQTSLIFPLRWAGFPIKIGRNAQWIHPFSSIFDGKNDLSMGTPYTFDEGMSCHSSRIELFYFDENFRRIAQWVRPFMLPLI